MKRPRRDRPQVATELNATQLVEALTPDRPLPDGLDTSLLTSLKAAARGDKANNNYVIKHIFPQQTYLFFCDTNIYALPARRRRWMPC